jgi:hypothetical protein
VGADENGERLIGTLRAQEQCNFDILGVFDDRSDGRSQEICAGVPNLGKVDDILEFARRTRVDLVLFALPISAEKRVLQMLKKRKRRSAADQRFTLRNGILVIRQRLRIMCRGFAFRDIITKPAGAYGLRPSLRAQPQHSLVRKRTFGLMSCCGFPPAGPEEPLLGCGNGHSVAVECQLSK